MLSNSGVCLLIQRCMGNFHDQRGVDLVGWLYSRDRELDSGYFGRLKYGSNGELRVSR